MARLGVDRNRIKLIEDVNGLHMVEQSADPMVAVDTDVAMAVSTTATIPPVKPTIEPVAQPQIPQINVLQVQRTSQTKDGRKRVTPVHISTATNSQTPMNIASSNNVTTVGSDNGTGKIEVSYFPAIHCGNSHIHAHLSSTACFAYNCGFKERYLDCSGNSQTTKYRIECRWHFIQQNQDQSQEWTCFRYCISSRRIVCHDSTF